MVFFDVLGTMVDEPGGIARGIRQATPGLTEAEVTARTDDWQRYVDERQRAMVAGTIPYAPSTVVDREAASRVVSGSAVDELVRATQRLDAWPDSVEGLARIAATYSVVALSNAAPSALARMSAHAGLRWHAALSADAARTYKPHPDVYRLAVDLAGTTPDRLLVVAAHAWDLRGAQAAGMRTAYVARPVGDPPADDDRFDLVATGLHELVDQLGA